MRQQRYSNLTRALELGLAAGLVGTGVMIAARMFDQKYAKPTIPKMRQDPGEFMVQGMERVTGRLPETARESAGLAVRVGYGTVFGTIYGLWREWTRRSSPLAGGAALGAAVYAAGYVGWLPAFGFIRPVWKQSLPEIVGELSRHVAYGIATATAYETLDRVI